LHPGSYAPDTSLEVNVLELIIILLREKNIPHFKKKKKGRSLNQCYKIHVTWHITNPQHFGVYKEMESDQNTGLGLDL